MLLATCAGDLLNNSMFISSRELSGWPAREFSLVESAFLAGEKFFDLNALVEHKFS